MARKNHIKIYYPIARNKTKEALFFVCDPYCRYVETLYLCNVLRFTSLLRLTTIISNLAVLIECHGKLQAFRSTLT